jgi:Holliday junction resolvasome RuvABC endonuclease subunit
VILCIDPGLRGVGMAVFRDDGEVEAAQYVKNPVMTGRGYQAHVALARELMKHVIFDWNISYALVEHPRVYPGMPKTDLNDLLDVVAVGAAVTAQLWTRAIEVETVFPSEWKGNVPKPTMLQRIREKLSADERARCVWTNKSDNEDVLDAIGIGLWHHKRLNKKVIHND